MILSDTLSRLPCPDNNHDIHLDTRVDGIAIGKQDLDSKPIMLLNFTEDRLRAIQKETAEDPELHLLTQIILKGWPEDIKLCNPDIRPYFSFRESLAVENGVIFKGRQVLIPKASQTEILRQLHTSHQGVKKTQWLARESVFWRNINKDIENLIAKCDTCQKYQPNQNQEPTLHHNIPPTPWWKLGSDLYHINNKDYLIIVDYFSKYPIVAQLSTLTSSSVVKAFKTTCAMFGAPKEIVSDNGPQFIGSDFQTFTNDWGIKHTTSSPYHPKSNGLAERTIQTVKRLIKKCAETGSDLSEALLHLRATPIDSMTNSPAELMFRRQLITMLPSRTEPTRKDIETRNHLFGRLQEKRGKELPELLPGQSVLVKDMITKTWIPGSITQKTEHPRSYLVSTEKDQHFRRNRQHLRCRPLGDTTMFRQNLSRAHTAAHDNPVMHPTRNFTTLRPPTSTPSRPSTESTHSRPPAEITQSRPPAETTPSRPPVKFAKYRPPPISNSLDNNGQSTTPSAQRNNRYSSTHSTNSKTSPTNPHQHYTTRSGRAIKPNPKYK